MAAIYIMTDAGVPDICKIGKDTRWPYRYKQARCYTPRSLNVNAVFDVGDNRVASDIESNIKNMLRDLKRSEADGSEWYRLPAEAAIRHLIDSGLLSPDTRHANPSPVFKGAARLWDDWRERGMRFLGFRWRLFLFEEQSPEQRLKLSYGALYDSAYNNAFTYNPFKVRLVAGFEHCDGIETVTETNATSNQTIEAAWNSMIGTFGSPESEQVGWLRPGTRHTDIASRLALSGIHPFPLNRPKPLGAPARDQGSSVIAHGAIPRQHKVSMSVEIYT